MFSNLLHYIKPKKEKEYLDVKIYCIVDELSDANDDIIKYVRDYCLRNNVIFETRRFNSHKYSNDRNFIRSLPAFHLYINTNYNRTFYPNTRPIQHIQEGIQLYIDKIENKKKKREAWNKYFDDIRFNIRYIFGLTSLIDRIQRNKK